jgi:alginate O-acetyltransferase complex protein AlgJ
VIPPTIDARYAAALDALAADGIAAPDLRTPMSAAAAAGTDMYLRTDTHWTPQGAQRAAAILAGVVIPLLDRHESSRTSFATEAGSRSVVSGDLLKFLPLGPWQGRGPAPDQVYQTVTKPAQSDADANSLFGELDIPIALVGTSYSVNPVSGFEGALKEAVDADVLNVAVEGQGPFAPMDAYLAGKAIDDPRPDILVWEIPERYLVPGTA